MTPCPGRITLKSERSPSVVCLAVVLAVGGVGCGSSTPPQNARPSSTPVEGGGPAATSTPVARASWRGQTQGPLTEAVILNWRGLAPKELWERHQTRVASPAEAADHVLSSTNTVTNRYDFEAPSCKVVAVEGDDVFVEHGDKPGRYVIYSARALDPSLPFNPQRREEVISRRMGRTLGDFEEQSRYAEQLGQPSGPTSVTPSTSVHTPQVPKATVEEIEALVVKRGGKIKRGDGETHIDFFQSYSLKGDDLGLVAQYPGLTHLTLSLTGIDTAGCAYLAQAGTLRGLYLHGLRIGDDAMNHLAGLTELEVLNLAETGVTDKGIAKLSRLKKIGVLVLTKTRVRDFTSLNTFPELTDLEMSRNEITDRDLVGIEDLPKLNSLSLYDSKITDKGLTHLGRSKSLRRVNLGTGGFVTDDGIDRLRRENRDIEVFTR